ncbi:MAG TPA: hypothetical protein VFS46_08540 [Nitrososphaera sp.]|nr:hypothetical protein [Nitrososphaera sp.]
MSDMQCLHQCKKCGVIYGCSGEKCSQPFGSGYCHVCSSPSATSFMAMAG